MRKILTFVLICITRGKMHHNWAESGAFYFILLSFHCTKYIYYMYNEASLQQVHTQQGKLPKTIVRG